MRTLLGSTTTLLLVGYSILALQANLTQACGPGRAGGRRRALRKYPPLVQRQYVPNVSENTLGASGRAEGAIKRKDRRFKELVQNWNPDIEFRDDEKTGADRVMTQRLKEKLSVLAISVMNQWPNVKLRVIEGWDEDNRHTVNSLHYEGRAVDITTSDRDRAKYGMLARLAVEAGFDWVHYESRSHVHCSVKSEKADTMRNNGCFDAKGLVETPAGKMEMSQLQTDDLVLTLNSLTGKLQFSPIIMWLDRDESGRDLFVELQTKSGRRIRLTSSHLVYLANEAPQQLDLAATVGGSSTIAQPTFEFTNNHLQPRPPSAGSNDNNQNNYYLYNTDTQTNASLSDEGKHNLLNSENRQRQPAMDSTSASSLSAAAALGEHTFVTYARNAVVGQYLLVNPANEQPTNRVESRATAADSKRPYTPTYYSTERLPLRVVFKQIVDNHVQANAIEQTSIRFDQIVSVNFALRDGIYAPLTREGNIVVDSIVASCYALISDHDMAHSAFAPIRWLSYAKEWIFGLGPAVQVEHSDRDSLRGTTASRRRLGRRLQADDSNYVEHEETIINAIDRTPIVSDIVLTTKRSHNNKSRQIHWYASMLYTIGRFILPSGYLY